MAKANPLLTPKRSGVRIEEGPRPARESSLREFGKLKDGQTVHQYTLTNKNGAVAKVMTYGATLTELHVPDRDGKLGDVVLGFDNLAAYEKGHPFFGSTVGRVANRIANGKFTLDGEEYQLAINNGPNTLHGGLKGFDKKVWQATPLDGSSVEFRYTSPDGEENFPGMVEATVRYTLTDNNALQLDYQATTTAATPINLTNHTYFNVAGKGTILDHLVQFNADQYTPVDETLIPTGEIASVDGTPFDFREPTAIGARLKEVGGNPVGYDHNIVVRRPDATRTLVEFATILEPTTGRVMEVSTTQPGVQFYTGNFLDGSLTGKGGEAYEMHAGFCLEAQDFPNAINEPSFPSCVLRPGESYRQATVYKFSVTR
jgi:aldose 1-epimerase